MTRTQLWKMNYALPRTTILAIGIAASLFASSAAFAGQKEIDAIQAQLPSGVTIATASAEQLSDATLAAIDATNLKPTVIAGEALKGAGDPNFGAFFGAASFASTSARIPDKNKFAAGAAVSASTGKTANATQVPDFAAQYVTTNEAAVSLAALATKSNTAIGAIIGGRGSEVDAANRVGVANAALQNTKLRKAAQDIAFWVGKETASDAEAASFAGLVASANTTSLQKIGAGTTAARPDAADAIVDTFLDLAATRQLTIDQAPKVAKAIGVVADIEQVQLMAQTFGEVVATNRANSTAKSLIQAISTRNPKSPANGAGELSLVNKADEVGEVAAYFLAAIADNDAFATTFASETTASKFVFKIVKTMFKAAKIKTIKGTQTSKDLQNALVNLPGNFAASIGYTLAQIDDALISDTVKGAILSKLIAGSKAIGGAPNAADLASQFQLGFDATVAAGFEDGTAVGSVIDPETDTRNG